MARAWGVQHSILVASLFATPLFAFSLVFLLPWLGAFIPYVSTLIPTLPQAFAIATGVHAFITVVVFVAPKRFDPNTERADQMAVLLGLLLWATVTVLLFLFF
ncbi:MAG: hypothetical protein ACE5OY_03575 [Candidatus Bathyarchaeia archaeon]